MEANPIVQEETTPTKTFDAAKQFSKPKVRVTKMPYRKNPLKAGMVFQLNGAAYQVYEVKSRGRMLVRFLGAVEVLKPAEPEQNGENLNKEGQTVNDSPPEAIKEGSDG